MLNNKATETTSIGKNVDFDRIRRITGYLVVRTVFKKHPGGFEIVAISESKSDQSRSRNEWISVLQKEKNLNITLNFAGESAIGCVMAREYLNMQDDLLIYGVDDMDDTVKMIKEGKIAGSIVTSFYRYGYDSVDVCGGRHHSRCGQSM